MLKDDLHPLLPPSPEAAQNRGTDKATSPEGEFSQEGGTAAPLVGRILPERRA